MALLDAVRRSDTMAGVMDDRLINPLARAADCAYISAVNRERGY